MLVTWDDRVLECSAQVLWNFTICSYNLITNGLDYVVGRNSISKHVVTGGRCHCTSRCGLWYRMWIESTVHVAANKSGSKSNYRSVQRQRKRLNFENLP